MSAARLLRIGPEGAGEEALAAAAAAIRRGGVVAHPTETLYGLAVDPWNDAAVARLAALKGRAAGAGLIVIVARRDQAEALIDGPPPAFAALADAFWPGPLTVVAPPSPNAPRAVLGAEGGLAVRVTPDPIARRLIERAGIPLTSTSANRSNERPASTAEEALGLFGDAIDLVLDGGPRAGGIPSTLVDLRVEPPAVVREGAIPGARIEAALRRARGDHEAGGAA